MKYSGFLLWFIVLLAVSSPSAFASDDEIPEAINVIWLATASALVFFMQAGFALLESGMSRAKNCVNVVMKNYSDVCIGSLFFWLVGFGLMFGVNKSGWFGTSGFAMNSSETWDYSFLLFQTMFAATAATIASGAMAERAKFSSYLLCSVCITAFIYPIFGSWAWGSFYEGQGWLAEAGFIDFAGSTVVHSVGGWAALAAVIILGPRAGRYGPDGEIRQISGHNLNYIALGGFILWFGWFGFNGGSTVSADVNIGLINLNTQLAAASGLVTSVLMCKLTKTPVLVPVLVNGSLAGLVGITAGCASMEPLFAILTGAIASLVAMWAERGLLKMGVDDVVSAIAVHGFGGAAGTICAGMFVTGDLFNAETIFVQVVGVGACFVWTLSVSLALFKLIDVIFKLRAEPIHEQRGLDFTEHDEIAYPEFMQNTYYTKENLTDIKNN